MGRILVPHLVPADLLAEIVIPGKGALFPCFRVQSQASAYAQEVQGSWGRADWQRCTCRPSRKPPPSRVSGGLKLFQQPPGACALKPGIERPPAVGGGGRRLGAAWVGARAPLALVWGASFKEPVRGSARGQLTASSVFSQQPGGCSHLSLSLLLLLLEALKGPQALCYLELLDIKQFR